MNNLLPAKNNMLTNVSSINTIAITMQRAQRAQLIWQTTPLHQRIKLLRQLEKLIIDNKTAIVDLLIDEIKTPISNAYGDVDFSLSYINWFCKNVKRAIQPTQTFCNWHEKHELYYEPLGIAAVITPWNVPLDIFVWNVIPNLLVGNVVIYKPSTICQKFNQLLDQLCNQVLPEGVFQTLYGNKEQAIILLNQSINLVCFTGSVATGKTVYQQASKNLIKVQLELGGSNPAIICDDADLDLAINVVLLQRFRYAGQSCDAVKRLIVHKNVVKQVIKKLKTGMSSMKISDLHNLKTTIGPVISAKQYKVLEEQVQDAISKGAKLYVRHLAANEKQANLYPPTLLTNVKQNMRIWNEEVFGPILPIISVTSDIEAVKLANSTIYGLGAEVFSNNLKKAIIIAQQLKTGNVDINGVSHFRPSNPFCGHKMSGIGTGHGITGLRELCQLKVIAKPRC